METKSVILLKLGGSLITDKTKPYVLNGLTVESIARQIREAAVLKPELKLIISTGAGSYGHYEAERSYTGRLGPEKVRGQCLLQDSVARLNRRIVTVFLENKLDCISLQPSSCMFADDGHVKVFVEPITSALKQNIIPLLYSDVLFGRKKGGLIFSTEMLFRSLVPAINSSGWGVSRIIYAGRTAGVYDVKGKTIGKITSRNIVDVMNEVGHARGYDVSGGMRHKLEISWQLARMGIETAIVDGTVEGNIKASLLGDAVKDCSVISAA